MLNFLRIRIDNKSATEITVFGWLLCNLLSCLIFQDEPSKIQTFLAFNFTYVVGISILNYSYRKGIIVGLSEWIGVFILKILITVFIVEICWVLPLDPNGSLRTAYQDGQLMDSNFYDYLAAQIVKEGIIQNIKLIFSTWLSFGIISYIMIVYALFGISTLYVTLINCLFILVFSIALVRTITIYVKDPENKYWQIIKLVMILPYESYYDSNPSKEPLTLCFMYLAIYYIAKLRKRYKIKIFSRDFILFFLSFLFLTFVRANLGIIILFVAIIYIVRKVNIFKSIAILSCSLIILYAFIEFTVGFNSFFNSYGDLQNANEIRQTGIDLVTEDSPLKSFMANYFSAKDIFSTVVYAPIRFIIWVLLPYPFIMPDFVTLFSMPTLLSTDWLRYFRAPQTLCRIISTWLLIYNLPYIIRPLFEKKIKQENREIWRFIFFLLMFFTIIISTNNFVNGGRYRTVVEPLYFVAAVIGGYKFRETIINRKLIYTIIILPVLIIFLITTI